MAYSVSPQVDVGALSIRGLSAFGPLLEALSADNVYPTAVIQMESLGGTFLISGKHAAKVPDHLQRCSSVPLCSSLPLGRLALYAGWRKGDTASTMAGSAGGQAVALLSLCIFNLYAASEAGNLLFGLSRKLLPTGRAISSVAQLVDVGKLLQDKLSTLGFGNELAQQVVRLHKAYQQLDLEIPDDVLETIATESMIDLLELVSIALRDEKKLVRITGTRGLGHILGLMMTMFPEDTLVTVNGAVICEGSRKAIVLDFGMRVESGNVAHYRLETRLPEATQPFKFITLEVNRDIIPPPYSFTWNNWIKDFLQLKFLALGLTCPVDLLTACCEILIQIAVHPETKGFSYLGRTESPFSMNGLLDPTDPDQLQKLYDCCQVVLGVMPSVFQHDEQTAFSNLVVQASKALNSVACSCGPNPCDFLTGWELSPRSKSSRSCKRRRLWNATGLSLDYAFWSFFIDPGPNTTVRGPRGGGERIISLIHRLLGFNKRAYGYISCEIIHSRLLSLFTDSHPGLASSSGSNTIFPVALRDIKLHRGQYTRFELREGQLIFNGRYYNSLKGHETSARSKLEKGGLVTITSRGEHSSLDATVRECLNYLELRVTARVLGMNVDLNLESIIIASLGVQETDPCEHSMNTSLRPDVECLVTATSVAHPFTSSKKIGVAQTWNNPTAQLLCCEPGMLAVLLKDCCLNCALDQLLQRPGAMNRMIIV